MAKINNVFGKVTDFFYTQKDDLETFEEVEEFASETVTEGNTVRKAAPELHIQEETPVKEHKKPVLKLFKQETLDVVVYQPTDFMDTPDITQTLKSGKAVVINFDKVDKTIQIRTCDFMNGACYVLRGSVRRISENIVMYVPNSAQFLK